MRPEVTPAIRRHHHRAIRQHKVDKDIHKLAHPIKLGYIEYGWPLANNTVEQRLIPSALDAVAEDDEDPDVVQDAPPDVEVYICRDQKVLLANVIADWKVVADSKLGL